jgi:uncharacterized protein YndB with AHSA1/START domain
MPRVVASRVLLASRQDVWGFLAEPFNLPDWWPGVAGVEPDRRGLAPGARWRLHGGARPTLLRKPDMTGTLVVLAVEPFERLSWQFTGERLDVELRLTAVEPTRTNVELSVSGPLFIGLRRSLPRTALNRLHGLCQTAAEI